MGTVGASGRRVFNELSIPSLPSPLPPLPPSVSESGGQSMTRSERGPWEKMSLKLEWKFSRDNMEFMKSSVRMLCLINGTGVIFYPGKFSRGICQ